MNKIFGLLIIFPAWCFAQHSVPVSVIRGQAVGGSAKRIDAGSAKGVVIFFTGTRCPYDELYRDRLEKLAERYKSQIVFARVNAMPGEDPAEMVRQAELWKSVGYAVDSAQVMFRALGAKKTTEVFLLHKRGEKMEVYYRGPVDDNPQVESDTNRNYLDQAIINLLNDKPSEGHIDRIPGCLIRTALPDKH